MRPARSKKPYTKRLPSKDRTRVKIRQSAHFGPMGELRRMTHEAIDRLELAGVTHAKGCRLYVSPVSAKGQPVTVVNGLPLEDIVIAEPYRSTADDHWL